MARIGKIERKTTETQISVTWNLDQYAKSKIDTGIPFLDHMLETLGKHSGTDLTVSAKGDLHIDPHHTSEDIGICIGLALEKALGEKKGINRFGFASIPMDEALVNCSIDLSGRFKDIASSDCTSYVAFALMALFVFAVGKEWVLKPKS